MNIRPSTGFSSPSPSFGPRSVVVLMSGGVDSSVTAWLLKKEGRHVAGLTMRIPGQDGGSSRSCCGRDAAEVALSLSIPHYIADLEEELALLRPELDESVVAASEADLAKFDEALDARGIPSAPVPGGPTTDQSERPDVPSLTSTPRP